MSFLLDSHTLLWIILNRSKLPTKVIETLENTQNRIYVSSVSIWEISLKYSLGKLKLNGRNPDDLPEAIITSGFEPLDLSPKHTSTFYKLPLTTHRDPFDRMLIWQAIQMNLTLVSKDSRLQQYEEFGLKTLW